MEAERRLTILGALDRATAVLAEAGIREPRREAVRLIGDLLGMTPGEVMVGTGAVVEPDRRRWLDRAVARRARGEPLAYVTGLAGFRRLDLRVDPRVLIPRPETEGLVDHALRLCPAGLAMDIGTGSGCLALALRQEGRYRQVVAVDRSRDALAVAADNRRRTGLDIRLVRGDLSTAMQAGAADLIVSNPPYISAAEYDELEGAVRGFEPRLALESGADGLEATARLVADCPRVLRPGGWLVMEIAAERGEASGRLAVEAGLERVRVEEDLFGRPRYLMACKGEQ